MKPYFTFYLFFLSIVLTSSSCQKEETSERSNFTATIDGRQFLAKSNDIKSAAFEAHLTRGDSVLRIKASNESSVLNFFLNGNEFKEKIGVGEYALNRSNVLRGASYYDISSFRDYRTTESYTGKLTIKEINYQTKKITGTFYFDAYNSGTNNVAKITGGSFNITFVNF